MKNPIFHKLYNLVAIILVIAFTIYSYFAPVGLTPFFIIVGIYAVAYILIMAIKKENLYKVFLFPLIGIATSFGLMSCTLMICSSLSNFANISETKTLTEAIRTNATNYKEVFEDANYYFYIDRDYEKLLQINKNDMGDLVTYPIRSSSDVSSDFSVFSPFYDISTAKSLTKTCDFDVHFAFMKNVGDNSLLLRLVINQDVYYTYIALDNTEDFVSSCEAFAKLNTEGFTSFYLTVNSYSVDYNSLKESEEGDEIVATKDVTGLLTATEHGYYFSDAMYVKYESSTPDYIKRVNNFYNKEILDAIKPLSSQLLSINPESELYAEIETEVDNLRAKMEDYYVEIVNETIQEDQTFRYYRTYIPESESSTDVDLDVVSIYEWEKDGQYFIATTSIDTYQLFSYSQYK